MNKERDEFLTEAMDLCWHEDILNKRELKCTCGRHYAFGSSDFVKSVQNKESHDRFKCKNINFSTWEGFGKLFEWSQKQEWLWKFKLCNNASLNTSAMIAEVLVNPDKFANAVYEFLKERK